MLLSSTMPAQGNGRFPQAQRLLEHPSDPNRLVLAATYGLLVTADRGHSWSYVCEPSFTHTTSYSGDPLIDFTGNESLLVNVQGSLSLAVADACDWTQTMGTEGEFIVDHSVSKSDPATIIAGVVQANQDGVSNVLRISRDNGQTWSAIGNPLPLEVLYTVDVDPRDPEHLYATGLRDDEGQLLSSEDQGQTWSAHRIANTDATEIPYLAGIDPLDSQHLYVRTDSSRSVGETISGDALLYSSDGGRSFREVFRIPNKLLGFALAPDGSRVLVGFGNPSLTSATTPDTVGVFKSSTEVFSFQQIYAGTVNCLAWTKTGVYVCADETRDGFELGFSPDADFGRDRGCLLPLLHRTEVRGALTCGPGKSAAICSADWPTDCALLGACSAGGGAPSTECLPFTPARFSSGGAGATNSGGASAATPRMPAEGGCDCQIATPATRNGRAPCLLLALGIAGLSARRRRQAA